MGIRTEITDSWKIIVLLGVLASGLLLGAGCNQEDDTADMAAEMEAMRSQSQTKRNKANATPPPVAENPCGQTAEGDGEPAEPVVPEYTGPKVLVKDFEVKLPYPEFNSAGRYDIKCWVQSEEPVPSSTVWEIIARGADEEQVGSKQLHLVIYDSYYKPLDLNSFYCKTVPSSLEFRATDKTASKPGEDGTGGDSSGGKKTGGRGGSAVQPGI